MRRYGPPRHNITLKLSIMQVGYPQAATTGKPSKIVVILGPTASGKSELAVKLAKKLNGEIISADSRQVYRGMNIGTAKPEVQKTPKHSVAEPVIADGVPHYLIDIKNPDQPYAVAQYKKDALRAVKKIIAKNKLPILVGGTGLYVKAVVDNLKIPEVKPNTRLRKILEKELEEKGLGFLYEKLIELDPEAAYIIDRHNPRRIVRALEIAITTGKPFSQQRKIGDKLFNALKIGIDLPKEKLKEKIEKRVEQMLKNGLVKEVRNLIKKYPSDLPAFDAIGYKEIIDCLHGKISLEDAVGLIKKNTWFYAKRQMTWFKRDKEIIWINNSKEAFAICRDWLFL